MAFGVGRETGKAFGLFAGAFAFFILVLAVVAQLGLPEPVIAFLVVAVTLVTYAVIGVLGRTMGESDFYLAGRAVPPGFNGMATAAAFISASGFVGLTGLFFATASALAVVIGATVGFVLLAVLIAPYFRKSGALTVPDFLAIRFGGPWLRLIAVIVLVGCSLFGLAAAIAAAGMIAGILLGAPLRVTVGTAAAVILFSTLFGGMRTTTLVAAAQMIVMLLGMLAPAIVVSVRDYGVPIPELTYGSALQEIAGSADAALATIGSRLLPAGGLDWFNVAALAVTLAAAAASLPHVLTRSGTALGVASARRSVGWALVFLLAILLTAPALAAFAKLAVLQEVVGATPETLPDWVFAYGGAGLVRICGSDAATLEAVLAACGATLGPEGALRPGDIAVAADAVALAFPDITGIPYVMTALIASGAVAAALAAGNALLVTIAGALGHDLYGKLLNPRASMGRRMIVTRLTLIGVLAVAAWLALRYPEQSFALAAATPALAAGGLFPALILGVWWPRATVAGAIAGVVAGFGVTVFYVLATRYGGLPLLQIIGLTDMGVSPLVAAVFGAPAGFVAMIVVSLVTPEPSDARRELVEALRRPGRDPIFEDIA